MSTNTASALVWRRVTGVVTACVLTWLLIVSCDRPAAPVGDIQGGPESGNTGTNNVISNSANTRSLRVVSITAGSRPTEHQKEKGLLARYAASTGQKVQWVYVSGITEALNKITAGEADIISSLTAELVEDSMDQLLLTMPWATSQQQVIGRSGSNVDDSTVDLTVRQVAMKKSSPAWTDLMTMATGYRSMEIQVIPEDMDVEKILTRVRSGQYDLAVMDSLDLPDDLEFRHNLEAVLNLSEETFISWGLNRKDNELQAALNQFVTKQSLESEIARSHRDDFSAIKQRKLLRVITYQSPVNYYYEHGRLKGFEYDLVKKFSDHHGLRLDVIVANTQQNMIELLKEGKGDLIAASVPEFKFNKRKDVKLSDPYNFASPVLVGRSDELLLDIEDLNGRTVRLPAESPYLGMLKDLRQRGIDISIVETDAGLNAETILYRIAQNIYDLTVLGSHEIKAELSRQVNLGALVNLAEPQPINWITRASNTQLLSAINEFIQREYRKGFYNVIHARYIDKPDTRISNSRLLAEFDQLSPYDEIIHKYADEYGFDWRLVVAQMYQESRFNPHAVSSAGAEGLMQILPQTAEMIGVKNLRDPDANIKGGLSYMHHIRNLFEDSLSVEERTWFTLASYNAGYRRVKKARNLAGTMGLNKNLWFNNVEIAMLKLAIPRKYSDYTVRECRCGQTVVYVREIRTLYNNYLRLTQSLKSASRAKSREEEI